MVWSGSRTPSTPAVALELLVILVIVRVAGMGVSKDVPDVCERSM
jgi:hypothetical protein